MTTSEDTVPVTYEELAELEHEFDDLDAEIIRRQYTLSAPLYAKRQALVSKIPNFWALVFELAPPEIDSYIQPTDSEIFGQCLTGLEVSRFEIALGPEKINNGVEGKGDPRSISIKLEFSKNEWFEDEILEKKFWWRRASDGWTGLVSEPVRVHWKKGKDMTHGLMDGAIKLWEARKRSGDMSKRDLSEFDALAKLVENWNGANTSFFTWFAFISPRRWVSAEESAAAVEKENARRQKFKDGGEDEDDEDGMPDIPNDDQLEQQVEVHEDGDSLASVITEDLWPGAIKYFTQAQENAEMSDEDFEDGDAMDDEDDGAEPIDIRALVQDSNTDDDEGGPVRKKQKK